VRVHAKGPKWSKPGVKRAIVDPVGMQLLVNPLVHTYRSNSFDVARARPEGQPIERVKRALLLVHLDSRSVALVFLSDGKLNKSRKPECGSGYKNNDLLSQATHVELGVGGKMPYGSLTLGYEKVAELHRSPVSPVSVKSSTAVTPGGTRTSRHVR
jgi:hypothetical protein